MGKNFAFLIILIFAVGISTAALKVGISEFSRRVYIKADGTIYPPTPEITTFDNVTYFFTSNVSNYIWVERDNIVIDGKGFSIQDLSDIDLPIEAGIRLNYTCNVTIKDMQINTSYEGHGIVITGGSNNSIIGTNITNNYFGIWISRSPDNVLRNNTLTNNQYNFGIGEFKVNFPNDIDTSNIVDGKPIYYWVNERDMTIPLDAGYVALINCTNITVRNLTITKNLQGIVIANTTNSTIVGNNITSNQWDNIHLDWSFNNTISENIMHWSCDDIDMRFSLNNTIHANKALHIYIVWSNCNTISGNSLNDFVMYYSTNNIFRNNQINGTHPRFRVQGSPEHYIHDIDPSNTINGKPLYYWVNQHNDTVPSDAGCILLANSTNIIVQHLQIKSNCYGISLAYITNSTIKENNITSNDFGIELIDSSNNNITTNTIKHNSKGIELIGKSSNNNIYKNEMVENGNAILLRGPSNNNRICQNNITHTELRAITLKEGTNANTISGNNIIDNWKGIELYSSNNTFYYNFLINNTQQVALYGNSSNAWDDGFGKGNYWSNYEEKYPNATEIDESGIWNTPYIINKDNQDNYPIVPEFSPLLIMPLLIITTLLTTIIHNKKHPI